MAESISKPLLPYLPLEVWSRILSFCSPYQLWTSCRFISKPFALEVDHIFLTQHRLEDLRIHVHGFEEKDYLLGPDITLVFDRFSEDGTRAHFVHDGLVKYKWDRDKLLNWKIIWKKLWRSYLPNPRELGGGTWGTRATWAPEPRYAISDTESLIPWNDTEVPDLDIDKATLGVSFNWRKMLDLFYREEAYIDRMKKMHIASPKTSEKSGGRTLIAELTSNTSEDEQFRRRVHARQTRIREWYKENHDFEIEFGPLRTELMEARIEDLISDANFFAWLHNKSKQWTIDPD